MRKKYESQKTFNDRNKLRENDKRLLFKNPYIFFATRFLYGFTYYPAICVTTFCKKTVL